MSLIVEAPSDVKSVSPSSSAGPSQPINSRSEGQRPRSGIFQNLMNGRSSPFNGLPASASNFLRRSSSSRSINSESNGKKNSVMKPDGAAKDTAIPIANSVAATSPTSTLGHNDTSPIRSPPPSFSQYSQSTPEPSHATIEIKQPPEAATLSVSSPGVASSTSTLSVSDIDEDLISTRSTSPFEPMDHSQTTTNTDVSEPKEDLPESLRLMRVAQKRGIKVIDFAFEGTKREGVVEDWAWEGGAACKGFGIGIGGGAYNGPLKKYRPPMPEDDKMIIDSPSPSPTPPNIFLRSPNRPQSLMLSGRDVDRSLNSPPPPRPASGALSQSGFLQYLQQRQVPTFNNLCDFSGTDSSPIKRERSFASTEQDDSSPCKKRSIG